MDILCDPRNIKLPYVQDNRFYFRPKNDEWSHKCLYDILMECEKVDCLNGVFLSGGSLALCWKPVDQSREIYFKKKFSKDLPFQTRLRLMEKTRKINFHLDESMKVYNFCDWKTEYPVKEDFEKIQKVKDMTLRGGTHSDGYLRCMRCSGEDFPTLQMLIEIMQIVNKQGHTIVRSHNFSFDFESKEPQTRPDRNKYYIPKEKIHEYFYDSDPE